MDPCLALLQLCKCAGCIISKYKKNRRNQKNLCGCKMKSASKRELGYRKSYLFEDTPDYADKNMISTRDDKLVQKKLPKNIMKFRKYNIITFIPLFLFNFFSQYTNLYFLYMTILFLIPTLTPFARGPAILP